MQQEWTVQFQTHAMKHQQWGLFLLTHLLLKLQGLRLLRQTQELLCSNVPLVSECTNTRLQSTNILNMSVTRSRSSSVRSVLTGQSVRHLCVHIYYCGTNFCRQKLEITPANQHIIWGL